MGHEFGLELLSMSERSFLVDSHCHLDRLDLKPFGGELDGALAQAREQGVGHMLCVCIDLDNFPTVLGLAREHEDISTSVGVHPNHAVDHEPDVDELVTLAQDAQVVAIGETGLDYFRTKGDVEWQRARFRRHIAAAKQSGKPLIIHMRDATEDTLTIMAEEGAAEAGGVMHCFSENREIARRALDIGFYISFSGIVTFASATELKEVAKFVPLDRMLVETDSPYLAPAPHRGKPNYPSHVRLVAEQIAALRHTDLAEVGRRTSENFFTLFSAASRT